MNYVKSCLIITMLLGAGYAECDPEAETGYNCDCNEDTWQEYYPEMQGCYLQSAQLNGENLFGANLQEANLSDANLFVATFQNANLSGANLSGAYCVDTMFADTNFFGANLTDAYLHNAYLEGANLCNLTGSPNGDVCEQPEGIIDDNGDGYDDVSYDAGAESGDLNLDGVDNVLDVVILVNNILLTP